MAAEQEGKSEEQLAEGTLMSHLLELRNRLMKAVLALFLLFIPCALYANELFMLVAQPLVDKLPPGSSLQSTSVVGPFMTPFKVAFYVSAVRRHAGADLPDLGVRGAGPVPEREAIRRAAAGVLGTAVLRRTACSRISWCSR